MQVVPYRVRPGDPPDLKQPWLVIYLADDPIPEWFMVDSGSRNSLVPLHLARRLGLTLDMTGAATGLGVSPFRYVRAENVRARTEFGEGLVLNRPVVPTTDDLKIGLLGREDFFQAYVITFDQRNLRFEIDRQRPPIGFARPN